LQKRASYKSEQSVRNKKLKIVSLIELFIRKYYNARKWFENVKKCEGVAKKMHQSNLLVAEGDAWHVAAAYPDICASAAKEFIGKICAK
jgi:hypothetical protein